MRNTMNTFIKTNVKNATKGILTFFFRAVEDTVKLAVNRGVANNDLCSRVDSLTHSQEFVKNDVGCLMKTLTSTAPITKPIKRYAEIAIMNEARSMIGVQTLEKDDKEATPPSPSTARSTALPASLKKNEKMKSEKKKEVPHCSALSCKKYGRSRCSSNNHKVDRHNEDAKNVNLLRPVNILFTKSLNLNSYRLDIHSWVYQVCISGKIVKWARQMDVQMK